MASRIYGLLFYSGTSQKAKENPCQPIKLVGGVYFIEAIK
jgi:hypothetical protein